MNTLRLPLDQIAVADRLRGTDEDYCRLLADGIALNGQLTPIEVRSTPNTTGKPYTLVSGAHRLRALELLGWPEVDAVVFEGNELAARLREIDENLLRHELTALDRATFLAERKAVYEALYPETKHGDFKHFTPSRQLGDLGAERFTQEAAERLGFGERTIQRAIALHRALHPDVRQRLTRTWLADHGQQLEALRKLPPSEQLRVVALLLGPVEDGFKRPKSVKEARDMVHGTAAAVPLVSQDDLAFETFLSLWRRRSPSFRRRVRDFVTKEKS